jgi:hypothetical protein
LADKQAPTPRLAGLALRAAARAIELPGIAQAMVAVIRERLGVDALGAVDLRRDDARPMTRVALRPRGEPTKRR